MRTRAAILLVTSSNIVDIRLLKEIDTRSQSNARPDFLAFASRDSRSIGFSTPNLYQQPLSSFCILLPKIYMINLCQTRINLSLSTLVGFQSCYAEGLRPLQLRAKGESGGEEKPWDELDALVMLRLSQTKGLIRTWLTTVFL